ncbi:MAG: extracellular solute-binding protein, partial [Clostridiales bacterium]|nr:extracellular solute-binding protein [Clostridiales bacterium]
MKKLIKRYAKLAAAGALALMMAACDSGADTNAPANSPGTNAVQTEGEKVTLNVINYHVGTDFGAEYYAYLFDSFQQTPEGQNVEFVFEEIPTTDAFNQKIKLLISSGNLPDIVLNGGNNITEMAVRAGKVADLTPFFDADPEWRALFDDRSLEFNTVDGKIYGVPVSKEVSYIYYNKDLFTQAGITPPDVAFADWGEFFAACEQFKAAGITPLGMDTADSGWLSNLWFSALIATQNDAGEEWMNTMYPTDYETPEVIAAATDMQKMLAEYTTADAVGGKYDPMATHFFNGEVAMFPNGPWMIPDFRNPEKAPEGFYDKVGIMLLPGSGMEMVPTPGDMVGATDPAKIEAAVAFLKYETTVENQIKALEMTGLQPVSNDVVIPPSLEEN